MIKKIWCEWIEWYGFDKVFAERIWNNFIFGWIWNTSQGLLNNYLGFEIYCEVKLLKQGFQIITLYLINQLFYYLIKVEHH